MRLCIALGLICSLLPELAFGQQLTFRQGAYDTAAQAYFNALTGNGCTTPSVAFKAAVSAYVVAEKTAGNWGNQDAEYILATADSCTASVNLAQPSLYKVTWNGSCVFAVQTGLQGDSTTCYGDMGVNESALTRISQNNAHFDVWATPSNAALGLISQTTVLRLNDALSKTTLLNGTAITDAGNVSGLSFADRANSTNVTTGVNGAVQSNNIANASVALAAVNVVICRFNTTYCAAGVNEMFVGIGQAMNNEATHYTNVRALLIALGVTGI